MLKATPGKLHRFRKMHYWKSNSAPFISGDLFADMADAAVFSPRFRGINPSSRFISKAKVIFCNSDRVEEFLTNYRGSINASVLILGNSDRDFLSFDFRLPDSIKVVFAQNLMFADPRFKCLPIGLENIRLAWNGFPELFKVVDTGISKSNKVLIGPFRKTHVEREELVDFEKLPGPWKYLNSRLHPKDYADMATHFRFIAAPRGNGVDTHRFWETIYRGSIPIVKKSIWSENLGYLDVPFLGLEDWSTEGLHSAINSFRVIERKPTDILDIWWPAWEKRISSYL